MINKKFLYLALILAVTIFGFMAPSPEFYLHVVIMLSIWTIGSLSLNLLIGYTGLLNLGQAGFIGIGAYTSALLVLNYGVPFWIALFIAGVVAALVGLLIGLTSLRTKGMVFAIITLMFGIIVYIIFQSWHDVTGGFLGLQNIPKPSIPFIEIDFSSVQVMYFFIMFMLGVITLFFYKLSNSRIGKIFISIREDENLSTMSGVDIRKYKVLSFVIGCFFAGVAGSLFAHYLGAISPDPFKFMISIELVIYVLFGGAGTILGPIIGTFSIRILFEIFHAFAYYRMIAMGVLIVLICRFMPEGVYPFLKEKFKSLIP
jgi:branched-chain amino acid transport system permease protein